MGRAVHVNRRGGPEVLAVREVRVPSPGDGEVLVRVEAAGVAFGDIALREGLRNAGSRPAIPGYDAVGTVASVGARVEGLAEGDRVAVWTSGSGGYATHVVVPAWAAVPYPDHVDSRAVVSLVLNYLAAWQLLSRTAVVADGSTILVHSAAGGVGSALLELAALRGMRVIGTASARKADLVERLGAVPVDYRTQDVAAEVKRLAPGGVDAVFDALGSVSWRRALPLLRPGGHLIAYGVSSAFSGGRRSLTKLIGNALRVPRTSYLTYLTQSIGVSGYRSDVMVEAHHDWYRQDLGSLIELLAAGSIDPVIHRTYPLEQAGQAQAELGAGRATGKIVLDVR
ncbi:zinc-binding dehydrogenase [uncultured Arthrobacter sp.]|nr:zinc-binding dehydrogenase [uncultured Arthrobacter sp.]